MHKPRVSELLKFMERAFETSGHSLMKNLSTVREDSWRKIPPDGKRATRETVRHVGLSNLTEVDSHPTR